MLVTLPPLLHDQPPRAEADEEHAADPEEEAEVRGLEDEEVDAAFVGGDFLGVEEEGVGGHEEAEANEKEGNEQAAQEEGDHAEPEHGIGKPGELADEDAQPAGDEAVEAAHELDGGGVIFMVKDEGRGDAGGEIKDEAEGGEDDAEGKAMGEGEGRGGGHEGEL
jgi:hypothetical protein